MQEVYTDPFIRLAENNFNRFYKGLDFKKPSIPRLLHFIWLGSPLPKEEEENIASWKKWHSDWDIKIWTDDSIDGIFKADPRLEKAFLTASTKAEKADILRLKILDQEGGIYSDTDVICCKSFEDLTPLSFFAGFEMNFISESHEDPFYLGTAVLGASAHHPIIRSCIDRYRTFDESPTETLSMRSGPGLLSQACKDALNAEETNILFLPCSYFYPLPYKDKGAQKPLAYANHETMAIHLWNGSWQD